MFIRYVDQKANKEVLVNVAHITKIEVTYVVPSKETDVRVEVREVPLVVGESDPNAARWYTIYVGGEAMHFMSNPDSPVMKALEKIYKDAIKG